MFSELPTARTNQKKRTQVAIVDAARILIGSGGEITMLAVAKEALVSEATAYRYFPDLASLLREALAGVWASPPDAMERVAQSDDPIERVACATEVLMRGVLKYQGAVRAMIATSITRPDPAATRPGYRFGLIDHALAPLDGSAATSPEALAQLKRDLAVVVSAEALFTLMDLCGLSPDDAIASAVRTARTLTGATTEAAVTGARRVQTASRRGVKVTPPA